MSPSATRNRLQSVQLDEDSLAAASRDQEQERQIAIFDLLEENDFAPEGAQGGPYDLRIALIDNRLALDITGPGYERRHLLSLSPLRGVVRDYRMVCESYYDAIRNATPQRIEALDMGRRGLHNEGSTLLQRRLVGKVEIDLDTARRLFTLVCALQWRGVIGPAPTSRGLPGAVLFCCNLNRVRSPMAEGLMKLWFGHAVYVDSCGLHTGLRRDELPMVADPFTMSVMDELGVDLSRHRPKNFDDLEDASFDVVISLTPEAHHRAGEMARGRAIELEYWPTLDPTQISGQRDVVLQAYRDVRESLAKRIRQRFGEIRTFAG